MASDCVPAEVLNPGMRSPTASALLDVSLSRAAEEYVADFKERKEGASLEVVGVWGGDR